MTLFNILLFIGAVLSGAAAMAFAVCMSAKVADREMEKFFKHRRP